MAEPGVLAGGMVDGVRGSVDQPAGPHEPRVRAGPQHRGVVVLHGLHGALPRAAPHRAHSCSGLADPATGRVLQRASGAAGTHIVAGYGRPAVLGHTEQGGGVDVTKVNPQECSR